jgi:hypothetical protein
MYEQGCAEHPSNYRCDTETGGECQSDELSLITHFCNENKEKCDPEC